MSESPPSLPTSSQDINLLSQEQRIQLVITAIQNSGTVSNGQPALSLRQAAKDFHVPRTTLTDRFNGVQTQKEAHKHQLNMTAAQEEVLADWAKVMGRRGLLMTHTVTRLVRGALDSLFPLFFFSLDLSGTLAHRYPIFHLLRRMYVLSHGRLFFSYATQ